MRISTLVLFALTALCAPKVNAQSSDVQQKAAFEKEWRELGAKDPAQFEVVKAGLVVFAEMSLARMGFDPGPFDGKLDERTKASLLAYQVARKLPLTGEPWSFETMQQLQKDEASLETVVNLPPKVVYLDMWDQGYINAKGTWVIRNEKSAWPEQTTELSCDRATKSCVMVTAQLMRSGVGGPQLGVTQEHFDIERWDQTEMVTKPQDAMCTRYVYRINRVQKSVSGIRSTTSQGGVCNGTSNSEFYLVLEDGFTVWKELNEKWRQSWLDLIRIAPEAMKALDIK